MNWGSIGEGAAQGAAGQAMSLIFGGLQNRRQLKQAGKLQKLQIEGQKEMGEFNRQQAMQMWRDTNYGAQVEEARKAGMSISALYGGAGGGGGATAGTPTGNVGGQSAEGASAGMNVGMQMASQMALMKAQKENIEADTANKLQEAENKGADTTGKNIANKIAGETAEAEMQRIRESSWEQVAKTAQEAQKQKINEETMKDQIRKIQEDAIGQILGNEKATKEIKIKEAEATIQQFEAEATKNGISTKAPWFIKLISNLYDKIDILNKMEAGGK